MSASLGQARPGPGVWWLSPEGWPALEVAERGPFSDTAAAGSSTSPSLRGSGDKGGWTPGRRAAKVPPSWCRPLVGRLGPAVEGWGPSAGGRGWVCGYGMLTGGWAWPGDSGLTSWRGITGCCLQHQHPCVGRAPRESDATVSAPGYVPADSFSRRLQDRREVCPGAFSPLLCPRAQSASWKSGVAVSQSALGRLNVSSTGLQAQTF